MDHEIFPRCKNALAIMGIASTHPSAQELRDFLEYERAPEMLAGYDEYVRTIEAICHKVEEIEIERQRKAAVSQHVGEIGVRQEFHAQVTFTMTFPPKEEGFPESHLTILADPDGNVLKYCNTVNLPDPTEEEPKRKRAAQAGERVVFNAMVAAHDEYKGVKQTQVQRVTKARLPYSGIQP